MINSRPNYCFSDFVQACRETLSGKHVSVGLENWVHKDAYNDFNLTTKSQILEFITAGGLENMEFVNSTHYRISNEFPPPICDAYTFSSGSIRGYISIFYSQQNQRWIIKSLHRCCKRDETDFALAFRKAGMLNDEKNEE